MEEGSFLLFGNFEEDDVEFVLKSDINDYGIMILMNSLWYWRGERRWEKKWEKKEKKRKAERWGFE